MTALRLQRLYFKREFAVTVWWFLECTCISSKNGISGIAIKWRNQVVNWFIFQPNFLSRGRSYGTSSFFIPGKRTQSVTSRNFYNPLELQCFFRSSGWYAPWNDGIMECWPPARRAYASERILGMESGKRPILQKMLDLHFV